ncbi:hypothetical protein EI555_021362, partial [Monodon monoceros]
MDDWSKGPSYERNLHCLYFIINQYILTPGQCCISPDITHSYLEQETTGRNKSTQPDEQLPVNSKGSMQQKSNELVNKATYEGIELPEQSSRNFQVMRKLTVPEKNPTLWNIEIMICITNEKQQKLKLLKKQQLWLKRCILQRERDEAIMSRLPLANEERDEAIARAKHMEMSLKLLENINPEENDMTLQELLNRINSADTGIAIQKNGAITVDRIYKTKECKKRITAEEMN